jgi:hypothetical protein
VNNDPPPSIRVFLRPETLAGEGFSRARLALTSFQL